MNEAEKAAFAKSAYLLLSKADVAYAESQQIYQHFIEIIQAQFPQWHEELCLNGGGSPSFNFHVKQSVCNDLSLVQCCSNQVILTVHI